MLREIQSRIKEPHYMGLRDAVLARIKSGKLTEDMPVSAVLDSLDTVELTMELEELGIETTVPINSVGDLLWLFRALDVRRRRKPSRGHQELRLSARFSGTTPKVYLDFYAGWNRLAVQSRGPELPLLYCGYRLLIESHPQWLQDANVNRRACGIDHDSQ